MTALVKGQRGLDQNAVLGRFDAVQQARHMAMVAQIVRAAAVNRDRRRRRNAQRRTAGVLQRDGEHLEPALRRDEAQNLCRQTERRAAAPHALPHEARRERAVLLRGREALRLLRRACADRRPKGVLRPDPEIPHAAIIVQIFHADRLE